MAARRGAGWIGLAFLLLLGGAVVIYLGRTTSFYFDEWDWVQGRRAWNADALLAPHNEHLSLVPVLLYKLLFSTVGIDSYVPYRVLGVVVHLLVAGLLFTYARRRVGDLLALAAATVVVFLGPAWQDVLWPFQIGFMGSLAAGLGALLALDRGDRRGDRVAAVLLTVALATSSLGIPLLAVAMLEVLGLPGRGRRWPVVVVPLVLYGIWYLGYGGGESATMNNAFATPRYIAEAAAGAVGALFGLTSDWGRPLAVALVALLVFAVARRATIPWRLAAVVALPLVFWTLTGLARANYNEPAAPRYLYPGVVFLLLIAVEAAAGARVGRRGTAALLVLLAFVTVSNLGTLRNGGGWLRDRTAEVDGSLAALQLAAPHGVAPDFQPEPEVAPQIHAAAYFAAARDFGSPAPGPGALPRMFERSRAHADATLVRAYGLALKSFGAGASGGGAPAVEGAEGATTQVSGSCVRAGGPGAAEVTVPAAGLLLRSDGGGAKVFVRRFSDVFEDAPVGELAAGGQPEALRIPGDAAKAPWHARLALEGAVRVCGL